MAYSLLKPTTSFGDVQTSETFYNIDLQKFAVAEETNSSIKIIDTEADFDRPFSIDDRIRVIPNGYKGTSIDSSVFPPSKSAVQIYHGIDGSFSFRDESDLTKPRYDFPCHAHIILQTIRTSYLNESDLHYLLDLLLQSLFFGSKTLESRLGELFRGALNPKD